MTPEFSEESKDVSVQPTKLPSVMSLFSEGWNYVQNNLWLVALLSAPFLITDIVSYVTVLQGGALPGGLAVFSGLLNLAALIVYFLFMATALHMVVHQSVFSAGFAWAKMRIFSLLWISILTLLIVSGGFLLLIIPGIIVAVYLSLSQIVLAAEDKTGIDALMRSRELVADNWLAVFGKIFGVQLLYLLIVVLCGVVLGLVATFFTNEALGEFITNVLFTILSSIGTLILLTVTWRLYSVLRTRFAEAAEPVTQARTKYSALGWLGLLMPLLLAAVLSLGAMALMSGSYDWEAVGESESLRLSLQEAQDVASQYQSTQTPLSYAGVCDELEQLVLEGDTVECNDSVDAYAVAVIDGFDYYCADSTGYNKLIYIDLDARTQCLEIGG